MDSRITDPLIPLLTWTWREFKSRNVQYTSTVNVYKLAYKRADNVTDVWWYLNMCHSTYYIHVRLTLTIMKDVYWTFNKS